MYPDNLDVFIIGGSLGGLFTAIALKSLDCVSSITIVERSPIEHLQDLGAGLSCNPEVIDAIREYIGAPPENYAASSNKYRFLEREGNIYMETPATSWTTSWAQLYRVFRESFDGSPKCLYRDRCELTSLHKIEQSSVKLEVLNEEGEKEEATAHIVIGADGAASKVRSFVFPGVERKSAGYFCYRGVVPYSQLSGDAARLYENASTFSWPLGGQLVSYIVPGNEATADKAPRMINWLWYHTKSEDELRSLMTDVHGKTHKFSLPRGTMTVEEIEKAHAEARTLLPALHAEIINKTPEPFVQVITDSYSSQNYFHDGKILLVGDAVGGQRSHAAAATFQCIFHGLCVRKLLEGKMDTTQWVEMTQKFSWVISSTGQVLGDILVSTDPQTVEERTAKFMKKLIPMRLELTAMWKDTIGAGNPVVSTSA